MNVTHDQILALLVLKDQKIINLEAQLALALAEAAELRQQAAAGEKAEAKPKG